MAYTTGFAQIVVKPSFKGFQAESTRAVKSETRNVGTDAGRGIGRNLMAGAARGVQDNQAQLRRVADAAAKAVEKALGLARSSEAVNLPGWCGPVPD